MRILIFCVVPAGGVLGAPTAAGLGPTGDIALGRPTGGVQPSGSRGLRASVCQRLSMFPTHFLRGHFLWWTLDSQRLGFPLSLATWNTRKKSLQHLLNKHDRGSAKNTNPWLGSPPPKSPDTRWGLARPARPAAIQGTTWARGGPRSGVGVWGKSGGWVGTGVEVESWSRFGVGPAEGPRSGSRVNTAV